LIQGGANLSSLEDWRGPFKRPNKINDEGEQVFVTGNLSKDEFEMFRNIAAGYGMRAIARGYQCDVATVHRTIRRVAKKITEKT
jgi:DNA-binding CsgD family transcriptional regulator